MNCGSAAGHSERGRTTVATELVSNLLSLQCGSIAAQAQSAALAAYNILAGEAFTQSLSGQNLGSRTLTPGVYFFSAAAQLTGILTLDAGNDPNARFDFRIGTTLDTDVGSLVSLTNGAQAADIFW